MPPASSTHPVYDPTGRLTSTQLRSNDHSVINLHGYAYNAAHQRTVGTRTNVSVVGGSYSRRTGYSYDDAGAPPTTSTRQSAPIAAASSTARRLSSSAFCRPAASAAVNSPPRQ